MVPSKDMNYLLATDNRPAYIGISKMIEKGIKNVITTALILLVIQVFLMFVVSWCEIMILRQFLMMYIGIGSILEMTIMLKRSTAIRVRIGNMEYITMRTRKVIPGLAIMPLISSRNDMYNACEKDMMKRYNRYNYQWDKLDRKTMKNEDNIIDPYWEELGLSDVEIRKRTKCVRIKCIEPITKEMTVEYAYSAKEALGSNFPLIVASKNWVESDMSNSMHVKSLYKRVCSAKNKIDLAEMEKMIATMYILADGLPMIKTTLKQSVKLALSTDGTAGQFSKKSGYEEIWKEPNSVESAEIWEEIATIIFNGVYLTNEIPEQIVAYMLYKKREALEKDNEGNIKVTRIMNAPNLVARVCDSIAFKPFNDGIMETRQNSIPSIGMNVFVELKMILFFDPTKIYIELDFADYDGSQHPCQSFAVALGRIRYMEKNNQPEEQIAYMGARYERHMNRVVNSTHGMSYHVVGQQASGDITTTDDNTTKTSHGIIVICNALVDNGLIITITRREKPIDIMNDDDVNAEATGDDIGIAVTPNLKTWDTKKAERIVSEKVASLGWKVKEGTFKVANMCQDGQNWYLSHSVERRSVWSQYKDVEVRAAFLIRPRERAYGKWTIAAEMDKNPNKSDKAKLSSKYLTLTMTSIGMPEMALGSLIMLYYLRSASTNYNQSYSWSGIKATTIAEVDLNYMLSLQLQVTINKRMDWIELKGDEQTKINGMMVYLDRKVDDDIHKRLLPLTIKRKVTYVTDNIWNYRETKEYIVALVKELDKRSYTIRPAEAVKWWTESEQEFEPVREDKEIGELKLCGHVTKLHDVKVTGKYNVTLKCKNCFAHDKEKHYEGINICYNTLGRGEINQTKVRDQDGDDESKGEKKGEKKENLI
jgi:hypothetical protein